MFPKTRHSELERQIKLLKQQRDSYKEMAEALQESEMKYRSILENIEDSYLEVDLKGNFRFFNNAFCKLMGYPRDELEGRNNREFLDATTAEKVFRIFRGVFETQKPVTGATWEIIRKDGTRRYVEASVSLIMDAGGNPMGFRGIGRDVTIQKETEATLALNEARFRDISLSMADWIWEVDKKGRYTFTAGNIKKILGFDHGEVLGKTPFEFMPDPEAERIAKIFSAICAEKGPIVDLKNWNLKKDGSRVCLLTNGVPIMDNHGELLGYRGIDKDITKSLLVEKRLKRALKTTNTIINNLPIGMIIVGRNKTVYRVNKAALDILGQDSEAAIVGHECHQNICPALKGQCPITDQGQTVDRSEKTVIHKDGREIPVFKTALPIELEGREVLLEAFMDISPIKDAERALRESEERLRIVMETIVDPVAVFDEQGRATYVNPAFKRIFGWDAEELIGWQTNFVPDELIPETRDAMRRILQGERISGLETRRTTKSGRTIDVRAGAALFRIPGGHPKGIVANFQDITREKQANEELTRINRELQDAMEQAELANAAKSEFLANMSHEIRTPMNGVIGMTDLVLNTPLTAEQREYLEMARMSANSLLGLLNDILDFSKLEAGKLELESIDFNLRVTLENIMDSLAFKAHQKGLELICHIRPDVPTALVGDPGRLRQVIVNLAGNAIKFTEKGEVVIRVEREGETDTTVTLLFMVADTGIGVPAAKQASVFHSFKQADGSTTRKYGGSGLGLSISKQLVEMMGGEIRVESPNPFLPKNPACPHYKRTCQGGPGSLFHFTASFAMSRAEEITHIPLDQHDLEGLPTLVVDDNATNRLLLQEMLAAMKLVPTTAVDGWEAMRLAERALQRGTPYRLALVDMQMPEIDGFQLGKMMKQAPLGKELKIIMLSSAGERGDSKRCKEAGIAGYLSKPVKLLELLDTILITMGLEREEVSAVITRHTVSELRERLNILLAEDNPVNQALALKLLKARGHQVTVAPNGKEAVEAFQQGDFDLILMDIQMPEMDGFEATRKIRGMTKGGADVPIIAMTAHSRKEDQERCLKGGMNDYVPKPITPETLFQAIANALRSARQEKQQAVPGAVGKPLALKAFDLAKAMETVLNDEEIFREITEIFLQELPADIAKIRQGVMEKDSHALERAAHSLKGAVGNFGAEKAYRTALQLESLGKQNKLEKAAQELSNLEQALDELTHELKLVLKGMSHEDPDSRR